MTDETPDDDATADAAQAAVRASISTDLLLYAVLALLVGGAWAFVQRGYYKAGDDVGYWLGVAGGVMMLALFVYPLRKHVRAFHRWGRVKWWFWVHMVLGIGGPLLILLHSTFRIGSINAAVAFYSMLIVAGSGVVGRFLFVRVSAGLHGHTGSLSQLQARAGLDQPAKGSRLAFAPTVEARLFAFGQRELREDRGVLDHFRQVLVLPGLQWLLYWRSCAEMRKPLETIARQRGWTADDLARRQRQAQRLVRRYLQGVVRVALLGAYRRLFALWHVAHVPFVYLLVASAIAHVIAVHIY